MQRLHKLKCHCDADLGSISYMHTETCQALIVRGIFDGAELDFSLCYAAESYLCARRTKMK